MTLFQIITILIVLAAVLSYINYRFIRLPMTIGLMAMSLVLSLALIALGEAGGLGERLQENAEGILLRIDFDDALLHGMLAFLLFAGALHIDLSELGAQKAPVAILATVGVIASTFIIAGLTWLAGRALGFDIPFIYYLLFGALISPTDPIAVIGIMKKAHAPRSLEIKIAGESLFNDGIGVVVFLVLLEILRGREVTAGGIGMLLVAEPLGGALIGLAAGFLTYLLLKHVDNYQVEILLTLALAMGGYVLAEALHVSAPIAIVVAGLLIGNQGRAMAMSQRTRQRLDDFWELVDEILNAVLFVLIGLEVLVIGFTPRYLLAGLIAIPITLLARWVAVVGVVKGLQVRRQFTPGAIRILTWGGLRGGISVALALSLPAGEQRGHRELIIGITYAVVVFSILVQGLTIGKVIRSAMRKEEIPATEEAAAHI